MVKIGVGLYLVFTYRIYRKIKTGVPLFGPLCIASSRRHGHSIDNFAISLPRWT